MSKGIDVPTARLNSYFTDNLWTSHTYNKYGRIFRNIRQDGIHPEAFNFVSGEYSDTLLDDTVHAHSFFDVQPSEDFNGNFNADVWICFAVNLQKLYPSVTTERATEYAHDDALVQIKKSSFKVTGLVRGLEAFSDYELVKPTDNMKPFYLFRFNTEIKYKTKC